MRKILGAGAEATVYLDENVVSKERSKKNYRHETIDNTLRTQRTRKELKILFALAKYDFVPKIVPSKDKSDSKTETTINMSYVDGVQLKTILDKDPSLAILIGKNLTIMHDLNLIHGDLTTSNMILVGNAKSKKLFFIDFGLSFNSSKIEDKAVDIHLFKQALESKHFRVFDSAYEYFLKGYNSKEKKDILARLDVVEQRGRYKEKT